ncbi:MAG: hypothetical protein WD335_00590 [Candidatus Paceibacterota bacterium]
MNTIFLVTLTTPYIGMHKWTSFFTTTYLVKADTEKEVATTLKAALPPKDPEVKKALQNQDDYEEDEYFTARLYRMPENKKCILIPDGPDPSKADMEIKF